jgi:hypothetical protein
MKRSFFSQKSSQQHQQTLQNSPSSGPGGLTFTPPDYGIESIDHNPETGKPQVIQGMFVVNTDNEDFPDGQEFEEYDDLVEFVYDRTGIRMVPAWRIKRLDDHYNVGIPVSEKEMEILQDGLQLIAALHSSDETRFTSPDRLGQEILRRFTSLVEASPLPIRSNESGIIVETDPDEWPEGQQFEDYSELAQFLLEHTGLELIPYPGGLVTGVKRRYSETHSQASIQAGELQKLLGAKNGLRFFSPDMLAKIIAQAFPLLVRSLPTKGFGLGREDIPEPPLSRQRPSSFEPSSSPFNLRPFSSLLTEPETVEKSPQDILTERLDDVYALIVHENDQLPPFDWMTTILSTGEEFRKQLAADLFIRWFLVHGGELWGNVILRKLDLIRWICALDSAAFEEYRGGPAVAFRASPAVYVPLVVAGSKLSGAKSGASIGKQYLKPVRYDSAPSPAGEFIEQFNKLLAGEQYDPANTTDTVDTLKTTIQNETLLNSKPGKTYRRPGKVEAFITETKPGSGRTGSGETEIGWFGGDEEQLNTGARTIPYEGGHLIGDQIMEGVNLFDMYEDWNLAPQAKSFNNPLYITAIENPAVNAINAGAEVNYKVTVKYPADSYTLKPSEVVPNAVDSTTNMSNGETFVSAVQKLIKNKPSIDKTPFKFHSRVPNYWHARMEDSLGTKVMSGKGRDDPRGPVSSTTITETEDYQPSGPEQFKYRLIVDSVPLSLAPKAKEVDYTGANKVKIKARQKSFVPSSGKSITTLSQSEINDIVKHSGRSGLIHTYVQGNVLTSLSDLTSIKGVSTKTVDLLKQANITI